MYSTVVPDRRSRTLFRSIFTRPVLPMEFQKYPKSYRFSQTAMGLAFMISFSPLNFFGPRIQFVAGIAIWAIAVVSLCAAYYVIIRYPYLSLVDPADEDVFSKHFSTGSPRIYKVLNFAAIGVVSIVILSLLQNGNNGLPDILKLVYVVLLLGCLLFTAFLYQPNSHPTVSTFLRATVGVGVLFFPIFLPALLVGAIRCRQLLDRTEREITM